MGRYEEALEETRCGHTLEVLETFFNFNMWLVPLQMGNRAEAAAVIEEIYGSESGSPDEFMLKLAQLLVSEDAGEALSEVRKMAADPAVSPFNKLNLVTWSAALGDPQLALDIYRKIEINLFITLWHPVLSDMRRLPGFKTVMLDAGLVDYWRTTGKWSDFCHPVGEYDFECE